jgi:hypothetical protein
MEIASGRPLAEDSSRLSPLSRDLLFSFLKPGRKSNIVRRAMHRGQKVF